MVALQLRLLLTEVAGLQDFTSDSLIPLESVLRCSLFWVVFQCFSSRNQSPCLVVQFSARIILRRETPGLSIDINVVLNHNFY